jgi:cellulose synthase/poly-beta-1,6-N-acetylglucosamine synthase-like glycosyltransferase
MVDINSETMFTPTVSVIIPLYNAEKDLPDLLTCLWNQTYPLSQVEYCLINIKEEYLIENHLIIIKYNEDITNVDLIDKYEKIIKSFENPKTKEFIKIFFGNNAINIKELLYLLPIIDN